MVNRITQPSGNRPLVDDNGMMTNETVAWVQVVTNRTPIIGTGTPEATVEAQAGLSYIDKTGALGSVFYIKQTDDDGLGDKSKGWVLIG